jgi:hypothetical protein
MNKILSIATTCVFLFGLISLSAAATTLITVTGTVVDSATGAPVPQAMILLFDTSTINIDPSNLGALKLDTVFSGTDGKFQYQMTINAQSFILGYGVLKQGYQIKYSAAGILFTTVNLGTLKISKMDTSVKDTLMVSGTVVDSVSGIGVNGALVIMSTGGGFDTIGNTILTSADGTFSKQVIVNKLNGASIVSYIITDRNYQTKLGQNTATGKQLDLGTIFLKRTMDAVRSGAQFGMIQAQANRMSIYALNGRLLYTGRIVPLDKIEQGQTGAVIVKLANENTTIGTKIYMPALK